MVKEVLPINDVILEVKTKYHKCNKCEHESSNCKKNIGLPQELILQDHLKYIMSSYMVYHEQTPRLNIDFALEIIPCLSSSPNHNGRIFHPYGSTQWKIIIALDGFAINVISLCMLYIMVWIWNIFRKLDLFKNWNPK